MRQIRNIPLLLLGVVMFAGCSNEDIPKPPIDPATDPDAVELGVTAGVTLTKSAVTAVTGLEGGIAVYACLNGSAVSGTEDPYTSDKNNNYAVYTYDNSNWDNASATDKIRLTGQTAKIYAYFPAFAPTSAGVFQSTGTALKVSGTISDNATVGISVFPGGTTEDANNKITIPSENNADKTYNSNTSAWEDNSNADSKKVIYSAPGEVDYLYADNSTQMTANNGKASGSSADAYKVTLNMQHALSMVSFRIYNDGTYKHTGKLTKITLKNKSNADIALSKGTSPAMNIKTGIVTSGTTADVTYTRFINGTTGYTLIKNTGTASATTTASNGDAGAASKKFSILVLPDGTTKFDKTKVQVVFTIDDTDYPVDLVDPTTDGGKWVAGKNYLYTAKLSGKDLTITSVTVAEWTETDATEGDLKVN